MSAGHTAAVLASLRSSGLPVGDARKPDGAGWQASPGQSAFRTYLVLYPLDGRRLGPDASLGDRLDAAQLGYQVTAVGSDRRSAETGADIGARTLLAPIPVALGALITAVQIVHVASVGVTVDEGVNPPLFLAVDRYRLDL